MDDTDTDEFITAMNKPQGGR